MLTNTSSSNSDPCAVLSNLERERGRERSERDGERGERKKKKQ